MSPLCCDLLVLPCYTFSAAGWYTQLNLQSTLKWCIVSLIVLLFRGLPLLYIIFGGVLKSLHMITIQPVFWNTSSPYGWGYSVQCSSLLIDYTKSWHTCLTTFLVQLYSRKSFKKPLLPSFLQSGLFTLWLSSLSYPPIPPISNNE